MVIRKNFHGFFLSSLTHQLNSLEPLAPPPPPPPAPAQHEQRTYGTNNGPPPPPPPHVPRLDLQSTNSSLPVPKTSSGQISPREQTLSIMAEKKRQKWQRERGKELRSCFL